MGLIPDNVSAGTPCQHCGRDFADHEYMQGSLNRYRCPVTFSDPIYGFFTGGDPRKFHPDHESCRPEELANHKRACELWDAAEARGETPEPEKCPSGFMYDADGKCVGHVLRAPYGIGTQVYEWFTEYEPVEKDVT